MPRLQLLPRLLLAALATSASLSAATFTRQLSPSEKADTFASSGAEANDVFGTEARLRVRNHAGPDNIRHRKTWLAFNISDLPFAATTAQSVTIELVVTSTRPGTYRLHAIRDGRAGDLPGGWSSDTLTWQNAPHNISTGGGVVDADTILAAEFTAPGNDETLRLTSDIHPGLLDAIRADTNGRIAFIITQASPAESTLEFASSRHPMFPGPTIIISDEATAPHPILANLRPHPRLVWDADGEAEIRSFIPANEQLQRLLAVVTAEAETALSAPLIQYRFDIPNDPDRRLKDERRAAMFRVFNLGVAYRLGGDARYAARIRDELLAATSFPDWAPQHFLNVGELGALVAIGYDWIHDTLTPGERTTIRDGLLRLAITPGLAAYARGDWWTTTATNWNQVCNGGLLLSALAVADHAPDQAVSIINSALASYPAALNAYLPDGAWPEGPSYWAYGATYQALAFSSLKTALGNYGGYEGSASFEALGKSGAFHIQTVGPTGRYFDYGDSKDIAYFSPVLFWLSRAFNQPVYAWYERQLVEQDYPRMISGELMQDDTLDRFLALLIVWFNPAGTSLGYDDLPLDQRFRGDAAIAAMRSDWSGRNSLYLAAKAGRIRAEHAHMDLGSFVLDALGERWAFDLGTDSYSLPGYFDNNGPRYQYYRLNNLGHNTLAFNNQLQNRNANIPLASFESSPAQAHASFDLSPAYTGQATRVRRGFALLDRARVLIEDDIGGLPAGAEIRWAMHTRAAVTLHGRHAELVQNGRALDAQILSPAGVEFGLEPATPSGPSGQNPNTGISRLVVRYPSPGGDQQLVVLLSPREPFATPLDWPGFRPLSPTAAALEPDFGSWADYHLPLTSPAARAATADPFGSGVANFLAYALGASPGDHTALPEAVFSDDRLHLAFQRARTAVRYEIRAGSHPGQLAAVAVNPGAPGQLVVVPDPEPGPRRFMSLSVSVP